MSAGLSKAVQEQLGKFNNPEKLQDNYKELALASAAGKTFQGDFFEKNSASTIHNRDSHMMKFFENKDQTIYDVIKENMKKLTVFEENVSCKDTRLPEEIVNDIQERMRNPDLKKLAAAFAHTGDVVKRSKKHYSPRGKKRIVRQSILDNETASFSAMGSTLREGTIYSSEEDSQYVAKQSGKSFFNLATRQDKSMPPPSSFINIKDIADQDPELKAFNESIASIQKEYKKQQMHRQSSEQPAPQLKSKPSLIEKIVRGDPEGERFWIQLKNKQIGLKIKERSAATLQHKQLSNPKVGRSPSVQKQGTKVSQLQLLKQHTQKVLEEDFKEDLSNSDTDYLSSDNELRPRVEAYRKREKHRKLEYTTADLALSSTIDGLKSIDDTIKVRSVMDQFKVSAFKNKQDQLRQMMTSDMNEIREEESEHRNQSRQGKVSTLLIGDAPLPEKTLTPKLSQKSIKFKAAEKERISGDMVKNGVFEIEGLNQTFDENEILPCPKKKRNGSNMSVDRQLSAFLKRVNATSSLLELHEQAAKLDTEADHEDNQSSGSEEEEQQQYKPMASFLGHINAVISQKHKYSKRLREFNINKSTIAGMINQGHLEKMVYRKQFRKTQSKAAITPRQNYQVVRKQDPVLQEVNKEMKKLTEEKNVVMHLVKETSSSATLNVKKRRSPKAADVSPEFLSVKKIEPKTARADTKKLISTEITPEISPRMSPKHLNKDLPFNLDMIPGSTEETAIDSNVQAFDQNQSKEDAVKVYDVQVANLTADPQKINNSSIVTSPTLEVTKQESKGSFLGTTLQQQSQHEQWYSPQSQLPQSQISKGHRTVRNSQDYSTDPKEYNVGTQADAPTIKEGQTDDHTEHMSQALSMTQSGHISAKQAVNQQPANHQTVTNFIQNSLEGKKKSLKAQTYAAFAEQSPALTQTGFTQQSDAQSHVQLDAKLNSPPQEDQENLAISEAKEESAGSQMVGQESNQIGSRKPSTFLNLSQDKRSPLSSIDTIQQPVEIVQAIEVDPQNHESQKSLVAGGCIITSAGSSSIHQEHLTTDDIELLKQHLEGSMQPEMNIMESPLLQPEDSLAKIPSTLNVDTTKILDQQQKDPPRSYMKQTVFDIQQLRDSNSSSSIKGVPELNALRSSQQSRIQRIVLMTAPEDLLTPNRSSTVQTNESQKNKRNRDFTKPRDSKLEQVKPSIKNFGFTNPVKYISTLQQHERKYQSLDNKLTHKQHANNLNNTIARHKRLSAFKKQNIKLEGNASPVHTQESKHTLAAQGVIKSSQSFFTKEKPKDMELMNATSISQIIPKQSFLAKDQSSQQTLNQESDTSRTNLAPQYSKFKLDQQVMQDSRKNTIEVLSRAGSQLVNPMVDLDQEEVQLKNRKLHINKQEFALTKTKILPQNKRMSGLVSGSQDIWSEHVNRITPQLRNYKQTMYTVKNKGNAIDSMKNTSPQQFYSPTNYANVSESNHESDLTTILKPSLVSAKNSINQSLRNSSLKPKRDKFISTQRSKQSKVTVVMKQPGVKPNRNPQDLSEESSDVTPNTKDDKSGVLPAIKSTSLATAQTPSDISSVTKVPRSSRNRSLWNSPTPILFIENQSNPAMPQNQLSVKLKPKVSARGLSQKESVQSLLAKNLSSTPSQVEIQAQKTKLIDTVASQESFDNFKNSDLQSFRQSFESVRQGPLRSLQPRLRHKTNTVNKQYATNLTLQTQLSNERLKRANELVLQSLTPQHNYSKPKRTLQEVLDSQKSLFLQLSKPFKSPVIATARQAAEQKQFLAQNGLLIGSGDVDSDLYYNAINSDLVHDLNKQPPVHLINKGSLYMDKSQIVHCPQHETTQVYEQNTDKAILDTESDKHALAPSFTAFSRKSAPKTAFTEQNKDIQTEKDPDSYPLSREVDSNELIRNKHSIHLPNLNRTERVSRADEGFMTSERAPDYQK